MSEQKLKPNLTKIPIRDPTSASSSSSSSQGRRKLRSRISNFHITLNTNVRVGTNLKSQMENLQKCAAETFTEERSITQFVMFPKGGSWNTKYILGFDVAVGVEVGQNQSRLHCHVQFKVKHRSYVRLDCGKIKSEMNEILKKNEFNYPIAYVHVACHKPELIDYFSKDD